MVLHEPVHPEHPVVQVPWQRPVQLALHPEDAAVASIDSSVDNESDMLFNCLTRNPLCVVVLPVFTIAFIGTIILLKCSGSGTSPLVGVTV
jgi:hypothetical protein